MPTPARLNLKLIVAYDGTNYLGWQKTPTGPSVEKNLQSVLEQIVRHPVRLQAASRTDAGVHARGQVVNFFLERTDIELHKLWISTNCLLPRDISVLKMEIAYADFHPTLDCTGKEYSYRVCYAPIQFPQDRLYEWHYHHPLNVDLIMQATEALCGHCDFSSFKNTKKNEVYKDHVRHVESIQIDESNDCRLKVTVRGNHFLYKMMRNIVGTLVYIGAGKLRLEDLPGILASKDRVQAGMTAPPMDLH